MRTADTVGEEQKRCFTFLFTKSIYLFFNFGRLVIELMASHMLTVAPSTSIYLQLLGVLNAFYKKISPSLDFSPHRH